MKPEIVARTRSNSSVLLLLTIVLALAGSGLLPQRAAAAAHANLAIWHGYDFYYPNLDGTTADPAPITFHWLENASGTLWKQIGDTNGNNGFWLTNDLDAVLHECTNGLWKLYLNRGHASEELYYFAITISGVTPQVLGDVDISFPLNGSTGISTTPTYQWTGPGNLANVSASSSHDNSGNNYGIALPGTATSWTPGVLTPGPNSLFLNYYTHDFSGITFTTPTNGAGTPLAGWTARGDLQSYMYSDFTVAGGGGSSTLFGHYTFDDEFDLTADSSGLGNNAVGAFYSGDGSQSPQYTGAGVAGGAAEFDGYNALWWEDDMVDVLAGSYTISLWLETSQSYGNDDDDARDGAAIFAGNDFAGDFPVPMALTGDKLGFHTDDPSHTINSGDSINSGNFTHLVVTRDAATGQKQIYVNGVLTGGGTGGTAPGIDSTEVYLGYSYYSDQGIQGVVDDLQVYTSVLSASQVGFLYDNPGEAVDPGGPITGHILKAHYTFENNQIRATDVSGNGNDLASLGSSGTGGTRYITNNPAIGNRAAYFDNNGGTGSGFLIGPESLFPTLEGSFTISLWVQTTQVSGNDNDIGFSNAGLVSTFSGSGDSVRPMVLTGSKLGFYTGGSPGGTLHSTASITNHSQFVHVAVTRDQSIGEKKVYVNGALNISTTGSTTSFDLTTLFIGWNGGPGFQGVMDEIQFYEGVLSDAEVTFLHNNPGSTVPDGGGDNGLVEAVDAPQFNWTTGGDANWFSQTTETHDGEDAAQSGAIGDDESTWIETTINGPGTLSFWWRVDSDDSIGYDYLEFAVEGSSWSEISGDYDWEFSYEVHLDAGPQTVRWTYYKDSNDSAGQDAAWLDEVSFIPDTPPSITFQPIDQTNYSGYPVNLVADASGLPEPEWQWYKVGTGLIPNATSRAYFPTNSGTAGVAGSYYAIAMNDLGPALTRTAVVSFVSAPLAPDWSKAFNSQLTGDFDTPRTNYGIATLIDASGNIYSATSFTGTNEFGSETFAAGPGRFGSGLFKYTTNGAAIWGRAITNNGSGNSYPQCLARAPGDGVYMSGVFLGTNGIGTDVLQGTTNGSVYLARFDAAGNVLWVRTFGGTNSQLQAYHQLVSDPSGNVTLSARGNNFVDFGITNVVFEGQKGVLVQYDADGNILWIEKPSGWVRYMTYAVGRIYAVLDGKETNYIGGLTNLSDRKFALAALDASNGQAFWLQGIGSQQGDNNPQDLPDDVPAVSVSGSELFLTGTGWGSSADFGAFTVSWPTPNGQYFARFDTNGTAQHATTFGGTNVWPWAAIADASGNVYVTGDFNGYASFGNITIGAARLGGIQDGFYGQMFLAKFDRNGNSIWVRQSQSEAPSSFLNVRDLNLAHDGVWVCGFVNYEGNLGTHQVSGPITIIGSPFGFIHYWVGGFLAKVTEAGVVAPPLPVTLLNPQMPGGNFQFEFLSQSGKTNTVQSRTNLTLGIWLDRTNILGDGNSKTVILPAGSASVEFFRILTQ